VVEKRGHGMATSVSTRLPIYIHLFICLSVYLSLSVSLCFSAILTHHTSISPLSHARPPPPATSLRALACRQQASFPSQPTSCGTWSAASETLRAASPFSRAPLTSTVSGSTSVSTRPGCSRAGRRREGSEVRQARRHRGGGGVGGDGGFQ